MSGKRKTIADMILDDAPTAQEQLAFANQIVATDDELLAQAEHNERHLSERVRTLRETSPQVTGSRGGKTRRKDRVEIEEFMTGLLARGVPNEAILDRAVTNFRLSRGNLNKNYLRPLLKR